MIRQPLIVEKDNYDSGKSWISDGLPNSSKRRRRAVVQTTLLWAGPTLIN